MRSPTRLVGLRDALRRAAGSSVAPIAVAVVALAALAAPVVAAPPAGATAAPGAPRPQIYQGGGVIGFGDAQALATVPPTTPLNSVMVAIAAVPGSASSTGQGYWLAAADGGVFTAGDAGFYGSLGSLPLVGPVVAIAPTPDGKGYWLAAMDGGVFSFGDAQFYGSMGGQALADPVVAMAATHDGGGYVEVLSNGVVYTFGDARPFGSLAGGYGGNPADIPPISGVALTPDDGGYWLLEPDGWNYRFVNPSSATSPTGAAITSIADTQVRNDPVAGYFCNPYGPCEAWCSLFATWVWRQAGVPIPSYAFTGDMYYWAQSHTTVLPPTAAPVAGDAVLFGTGPSSVATSLHVGLVAQRWPDGAIVDVEGDSGPAPNGSLAVTINGPYLPSESAAVNGMPIYAYAVP